MAGIETIWELHTLTVRYNAKSLTKGLLWYTLPCGHFDSPVEQNTREGGGWKYGNIQDCIPAEPSCRGKGLGLEATQLMMYYGKDTIAMCNVIL